MTALNSPSAQLVVTRAETLVAMQVAPRPQLLLLPALRHLRLPQLVATLVATRAAREPEERVLEPVELEGKALEQVTEPALSATTAARAFSQL